MNKEQYLKELRGLLAPLSKQERDEILYDYQEHFDNGLRDGKTEIEVINELGTPNEVAKHVLDELPSEVQKPQKKNTDYARVIVLTVVLLFVNAIFIVGPIVAIIGAYFSLYSVVFALIFSPMVLFFNAIVHGTGNVVASFFAMGVGISLGVLVFLGLIYIGKWLFLIIRKYINFNVKLIRGY